MNELRMTIVIGSYCFDQEPNVKVVYNARRRYRGLS